MCLRCACVLAEHGNGAQVTSTTAPCDIVLAAQDSEGGGLREITSVCVMPRGDKKVLFYNNECFQCC